MDDHQKPQQAPPGRRHDARGRIALGRRRPLPLRPRRRTAAKLGIPLCRRRPGPRNGSWRCRRRTAQSRPGEARRLARQGRRRRRAEQEAKRTFAEVARLTLAKKAGGWKGAERSTSYAAWVRTIDVEAKALHRLAVDEIGVAEVKRVVAAKWDQGFHDE